MQSSIESEYRHSDSNAPSVDDWENAESEAAWEEQLQERFKQVKILQREKADKDARIEKAKQEEANSKAANVAGKIENSSSNPQAAATPLMKMQILRRPKSGDQLDEAEKARKEQEEQERAQKKPTLEERQAAYELARNRILGSDYKPEPALTQPSTSPAVSRNRSPEQIRVRRPSPETTYMHCYQQPLQPYPVPQNCVYPPGLQQQPPMNYTSMTGAQPLMPYVDTSRPPPPMNSLPPQGMSYPTQIPTFGTGQYLGGGPVNSYIPIQNPPMQGSSVQRPPLSLYPPGSLGAAMQLTVDSGQSQRQKNNKKKKNKSHQGASDVVH